MLNQTMIAAAAHAPLKVIQFGSYARGEADAGSDLDFLVVEQEIPDPAGEADLYGSGR